LLALLLTPFLPKVPPHKVARLSIVKALAIYRHASIRRLAIALGGLDIVGLGLAAASQAYLAKERGIAPTVLAEMFVGSVALHVVASILTGAVLNRGIRGIGIGAVGAVVASVGIILTFSELVSTNIAIVASVIGGFGSGILTAWLTTLIPAVAPDKDQIGTTSGVVSQVLYLGMFLGPPVVLGILGNFPKIVFFALVVIVNLLPLALLGFYEKNLHADEGGEDAPSLPDTALLRYAIEEASE